MIIAVGMIAVGSASRITHLSRRRIFVSGAEYLMAGCGRWRRTFFRFELDCRTRSAPSHEPWALLENLVPALYYN